MRKWAWSLVIVLALGGLVASTMVAAAPAADAGFPGKWATSGGYWIDGKMTIRSPKDGIYPITLKADRFIDNSGLYGDDNYCGTDERTGEPYAISGRGEGIVEYSDANGAPVSLWVSVELSCPRRADVAPLYTGFSCSYSAANDTLTDCYEDVTWTRVR